MRAQKRQDRDQKRAGQRPETVRKEFREARAKVINCHDRDKKRPGQGFEKSSRQ